MARRGEVGRFALLPRQIVGVDGRRFGGPMSTDGAGDLSSLNL